MTMQRTFVARRRAAPIPALVALGWRPWCTCAEPRWQPVVLFDAIVLNCHECATCGKPDRNELGRH